MPADTVRRVVNQIIQFGSNARPSLGVSVLPGKVEQRRVPAAGVVHPFPIHRHTTSTRPTPRAVAIADTASSSEA